MKIGLCLSGGGARGVYHMGVLQAFDDLGLKVSTISGCSAGALVGTLYSAGVKPAEMIALASGTKWFSFLRPALPNRGLIGMEYLDSILKKHIGHNLFEELSIPCKVVATSMTKGRVVVFQQGEIILPVLASCSVPMLFKPVAINDDHYLDGGILMNMPAEIIKHECDYLIGVSLMPLYEVAYAEIDSSFKLLSRVLEVSIHQNSKRQMGLCDLLIESEGIRHHSRFDLKETDKLFRLGYDEAHASVNRNLHEMGLSSTEPSNAPDGPEGLRYSL
ncbi:MAG TPA: patatin-like phospholipase family protein [Saprospiraceae bacterium]|nr:patatin-like phospholipase family protein [Saprospiraceae bacterium]